MTTPDTAGLLTTRIVLERHIGADGSDVYSAEFLDAHGESPSLVEIIGMLELAKDAALRGGDCDCDEDEP